MTELTDWTWWFVTNSTATPRSTRAGQPVNFISGRNQHDDTTPGNGVECYPCPILKR